MPPYARYSARQATTAATLGRLERDFEHLRKRQAEQIERLEDLVRELVLTAESLRRGVSREDGGED
jgi:glucose-6-phosphate-specific signal transduction histidine kinase